MKAVRWDDKTLGMRVIESEIPAALEAQARDYRAKLVEAAADGDERLLEQVHRERRAQRRRDPRRAARAVLGRRASCPYCAARRSRTRASKPCSMPSCSICRRRRIASPCAACCRAAAKASAAPSDKAPFAAFAFKIATDSAEGSLTFFRVYSGVLRSGDAVHVPQRDKSEIVGRLVQMHANERSEIDEVRAGDIAAAVGLKDVTTGDSLTDPANTITLEMMDFPEPVIAAAIEPQDGGGSRALERRARQARARGPDVARPRRRGVGPDDSERHGRAASRDRRRSARSASSASPRTSAGRRSLIARRSARPSSRMASSFVSSAAATSKRKFRCGSSRCRPAMATSSSTQLGRCRPARGRGARRRPRRARADGGRRDRRLPRDRRQGHGARRIARRPRFGRGRVQVRWRGGFQGGHAQGAAGATRADHERQRRDDARGLHGRHQRRSEPPARRAPEHRGLARGQDRYARACRSRKCSVMRRLCAH